MEMKSSRRKTWTKAVVCTDIGRLWVLASADMGEAPMMVSALLAAVAVPVCACCLSMKMP